jgi:hypothetical protein
MLLVLGAIIGLILVYGVVWGILWGFGRFFHQTLYTQVPEGLLWRSAAAAGVVFGWGLLLPVVCNYCFSWNWPITFENYFLGQATSTEDEQEFVAIVVPGDPDEKRYELRKVTLGLRQERRYESAEAGDRLLPDSLAPSERNDTPAKTFKGVTKDGTTVNFTPRRDMTGVKFDTEDGQVMTTEEFGVIRKTGSGGFLLRMVLLVLLIVAWFVALWGFLEFYYTHAAGCALALTFAWLFAANVLAGVVKQGGEG